MGVVNHTVAMSYLTSKTNTFIYHLCTIYFSIFSSHPCPRPQEYKTQLGVNRETIVQNLQEVALNEGWEM